MKSYRKELWFEIPRRRQLVNITAKVEECLRESGVQEGLCLVNTSRFPGMASVPVAVGNGLVFVGFSRMSRIISSMDPLGTMM